MPGRSVIPFLERASGRPVDALESVNVLATSEGLGWGEVHVEVGFNPRPWDVSDLTVGAHYLALNTDAHPLTFEAWVDGRPRPVRLEPGQMWFCPAGETFSHRVPTAAGFALVTLAPARVLRAVEAPADLALRRRYGVDNPTLGHLVRALAAEAERDGPGGAAFVDALATAVSVQLLAEFSAGAAPPASGAQGLGAAALRRVIDRIEASLDGRLSIDDMAREAALSPAHFARSFKSATGTAPHQYLMQRRLDQARRALEGDAPDLLNVAVRFGFSDQAHFTRLFKRAFGVTPGVYAKSRRR